MERKRIRIAKRMRKIAFRSKNFADVIQAAECEVWQHTRDPKKIVVGDIIYIYTSAKGLRDSIGLQFEKQLVVEGKITEIEQPQFERIDWVSKGNYKSKTYRFKRLKVTPMEELPVEEYKKLKTARNRTIVYLYKD